jgi:hypothetical protein
MNTLTEETLVRPSALPKLQECRCYVSKPATSEAAARGTALDAIIREAWMSCMKSVTLSEQWTAEDAEACNFALQHLGLLSHGEFVETREEELQAIVPVDGVRAGTMDALCVAEGWLQTSRPGKCETVPRRWQLTLWRAWMHTLPMSGRATSFS